MSNPPISFGTDGWRAVIADDFTYERVRAVAQGVARYLANDPRPIVVGHDARFSAELFAREVARVLAANGRSVLLLDRVTPTPSACWTVVQRKAAGAIVVTASHNPSEFNGLKYKPDFGGSAPPEVVAEIEKYSNAALDNNTVTAMSWPDAEQSGLIAMVDPTPDYLAQLGTMVDLPRIRGAGLRLLHEAMYGAGRGLMRAPLEGGRTVVDELHAERNPGFGGMHPEPIARYMPQALAVMANGGHDLCIANDGDADRVGVIDERGRFVNQLEVAALFAMYLLEKRGERGDLVRSLTSTGMLDLLAQRFGVPCHETPVGFKYIGTKMTETNALFGAEESGGFAFRGHLPERDGVLAGLIVAEMVIAYERPLSKVIEHLTELVGKWSYDRHDIRFERDGYAQRKARVYASMESDMPSQIAGSQVVRTRTDDGFKFYLDDGSWVLLRMSGTEPLMRIYSEAPDPQRVKELLAALEERVGVTAPPAGATA